MTTIPRRNHHDLFTPAERVIYDAVQAVEAAGCDVRLTRAVMALEDARAWVADFVDGVQPEDHYPRPAGTAWDRDTNDWRLRAPPAPPSGTAPATDALPGHPPGCTAGAGGMCCGWCPPAPATDAERGTPPVAICLRCSRAFTDHPHGKDDRCAGFVDDPAAPCLACGTRYDEHPGGGGKCPSPHSPWDFQSPAAYFCENRRCAWRSYEKPYERRCHACGARVWKDHTDGHKPRPALARPVGSGDAAKGATP